MTVPARDRVEVRFPAPARSMAGTARIQIAAVSGSYADAATVELPVYTPATTEAFATYGVVDEGAVAQPVAAPKDVFPQYGGLEITTSSTALQALTDAVLYLVAYPFECSEQLASRILAVAALRDVLTAFEAEGLPSPEEMEAAVERGYRRCCKACRTTTAASPTGGRGRNRSPSTPSMSRMRCTAREDQGLRRPGGYAAARARIPAQDRELLPRLVRPADTRWTLSAYALYVRDLMGDSDPQKALKLLDEAGLENLSLDAIGWLWPVLQDAPGAADQLEAIRRYVNNHVVETAGAANFTTDYDDQNYLLLSSDRRTDAILLDALIVDNPQQRPDPQAGQRPAGAPHPRALGQHPGECLRPAGAGPLLQHLRSRRRPISSPASGWARPMPAATSSSGRTTERSETDYPHGLPGGSRPGRRRNAGPDPEQGRRGAAVLPPGAALCAHRPEARPAGYGLCRPAHLRGRG